MFQAVRNTFIAATAALALGFFGAGAQAAVINLTDGAVINPVNANDLYTYEEQLTGTGGAETRSFAFTANASQLPLSLGAVSLSLQSVNGTISGFFMSLSDGITTTYLDIVATAIIKSGKIVGYDLSGYVEQAFNAQSLTQTLTIGWDGYNLGTNGSVQISMQVAAVPLPAGGLLLIGAIGGLAVLRRRKALAA